MTESFFSSRFDCKHIIPQDANMLREIMLQYSDVEAIYDDLILLMEKNKDSALRIMIVLYFNSEINSYDMHHVFNSLELFITENMNSELAAFCKNVALSEDRQSDFCELEWRKKRLNEWGCH